MKGNDKCDECYGTGLFKGFGGPCSQKPTEHTSSGLMGPRMLGVYDMGVSTQDVTHFARMAWIPRLALQAIQVVPFTTWIARDPRDDNANGSWLMISALSDGDARAMAQRIYCPPGTSAVVTDVLT